MALSNLKNTWAFLPVSKSLTPSLSSIVWSNTFLLTLLLTDLTDPPCLMFSFTAKVKNSTCFTTGIFLVVFGWMVLTIFDNLDKFKMTLMQNFQAMNEQRSFTYIFFYSSQIFFAFSSTYECKNLLVIPFLITLDS